MEDFRKQASCFGFNREPDFIQDPKNGASPSDHSTVTRSDDRGTHFFLSFSLQISVLKVRGVCYLRNLHNVHGCFKLKLSKETKSDKKI